MGTKTEGLKKREGNMTDHVAKFQQLLWELFQFDSADLDFGIYRIMNYKRAVVEKFITEDLPQAVARSLDQGGFGRQAQAEMVLKEAKAKVTQTLGQDAFDVDDNLASQYIYMPVAREYLEIKAQVDAGLSREALEVSIFNHLYTFFSRYYQEGDFISKRRYSRRQKYAIPYNGEEVYLYWANHDQYYVKTAEHFQDYTFTTHGVRVHFKLTAADVEQNNVKGDRRFFLPLVQEMLWDEAAGELVIPVEYRPLTTEEEKTYGAGNQQDAILDQVKNDISERLAKTPRALQALAAKRAVNAKGESVSYLEYHLRQYTRRNTSDFFIHKDLKAFLSRELDFYLKNEVLNLDEMQTAGEELAEGWFQVVRVIKAIGMDIIDFLAQIEDFQKMLWEKRKFVTQCHYCITVGNIDEGFYPEIVTCPAQWEEWQALYHVHELPRDMFSGDLDTPAGQLAFLQAHPTLVLDTRHFEPAFVDRLLGSFEDLDGMTEGLLVHSENWQALSLLLEKYKEEIKCIYIDPPYNTGKDRFPYKDGFKNSSWLALMYDRLLLGRRMLRDDGVLWCSIDANEFHNLGMLFDRLFAPENRVGDVIWRNARDNNPTRIATEHEYIISYARRIDEVEQIWKNEFADPKEILLEACYKLKKSGLSTEDIQKALRQFIKDNKALLAEVDRYKFVDEVGVYTGSQSVHNPHPGGYEYAILHPVTGKPMRMPANGYRFPEETMERDYIEKGRLIYGPDENRIVQIKLYLHDYQGSLRSVIDLDGRLGAYALNALFGGGTNVYENPKPPQLLDRLLSFSSTPETVVLDFFAGSGTTAQAVLDVARRTQATTKFILVEMADSFDGVILPRVKKLVFSSDWKDGRPEVVPVGGGSGPVLRLVKVIRLESYEDALNNIELDAAAGQMAMQFDDYLLKYMLRWEAKRSQTLLNVDQLARPFAYKLHLHRDGETRAQLVDVPETFNYLIGLHVERRQTYDDRGRRYLVYRGQVDHRRVTVIWRDVENWEPADFERDREFIATHALAEGADDVFVNGDSLVPEARALEPVFKARLFAPVEA